jgi:hypothetical protein
VLQSIISFARNSESTIEQVLDLKYPQWFIFLDAIKSVAQEYEQKKKEANAMDFDDLLVNFSALLNHETVFQKYANQFKYILVDEYQDTNKIQSSIIRKLASVHKNVLVVGDDAQSIYSFRAADIANILDFEKEYPNAKTWLEWTNGQFGQLYCVNSQDILNTIVLLFFGNSHQDLTEFVLQDLGLYRYEDYTIDHHHRIFKTREELNQYQLLVDLREQLDLAESIDDLTTLATKIPVSVPSEFLLRRKSKLCNRIAYAVAKHNNYLLALDLYAQSHLAPSRERQIRILEKQGMFNEAWEIVQAITQNPLDEQELQIAARISARLAKKLGKAHNHTPTPQLPERRLSLSRTDDALSVEEITRLHIHSDSAPCVYVENQLLLGLFGLWLWPEIFRGVDGAFANPFQSAPLDMYESSFITKRPAIEKLFDLLDNNAHKNHIKTIWNSKWGLSNHFVNWHFLQEELVDLALETIPAAHLKHIFQRILFDIKNNRSGLPDLIQFFPETKSYLMLEVKGPGDRVQDNQRRWFNFFAQHHIPAEAVYVSWQ